MGRPSRAGFTSTGRTTGVSGCPLLQRAERAVLAVDGAARVHVNRWGDGGAHLLTRLRGTAYVP